MLEYYSSYQHGAAAIQSSHLIPGLLSLQTIEVSTKFLGTYHNIQGRSKLTGGLIWIMNFADKLPNFRWTHSVWALVYESIDYYASSCDKFRKMSLTSLQTTASRTLQLISLSSLCFIQGKWYDLRSHQGNGLNILLRGDGQGQVLSMNGWWIINKKV